MKKIDAEILTELGILRCRLESGESVLQCLSSMGTQLRGSADFLQKWTKLSNLMLEGRVLPAKAIEEFLAQCESSNRLRNLSQQKTLSARIQALISLMLIVVFFVCAIFFFPSSLRPSLSLLFTAGFLALASLFCMHLILKNFSRQLVFLEWLAFLRSLVLSLRCGLTLPSALQENLPPASLLQKFPHPIATQLSLSFFDIADTQGPPASSSTGKELPPLWNLAMKSYISLRRNYQEGLSLVDFLQRMTELQEEEFENWMLQNSEKLSYWLLIPLFFLSTPALLILIFGPLLSAIAES